VIAFVQIALRLFADFVGLVVLATKPRRSLEAVTRSRPFWIVGELFSMPVAKKKDLERSIVTLQWSSITLQGF
jgi:hypothetical protein